MRVSKHFVAWTGVFLLALSGGAVYAAYSSLGSLTNGERLSPFELLERVTWRARFYAMKAQGGVPDLSWREISEMLRHRGGFNLAGVVRGSLSLDGSIINPYTTPEDLEVGDLLYRAHCTSCHAANGAGWHGPALNHAGLKHGDSDLAIYKVIRDGVPRTNMRGATHLSPTQAWQLVGYVRALQMRANAKPDAGGHAKIRVTDEQLLEAGAHTNEWLTYSGSFNGHRYSLLKQITPATASQLRTRWVYQFNTNEARIEATPIVVDDVMFVTEPPSNVVALDVRTGRALWKYTRNVTENLPICCGVVNRGLAIWKSTLFLGTIDGFLVAIDVNTGRPRWQTSVVKPAEGYAITAAPLIVNDSVIVGVSGGEYGIRGHLSSYKATNGELNWRFHTIPEPGEAGHETWQNGAWRTGGGPTWITGSYDPSLDLIYWGVGNPSPDFSKEVRPGDNLYTDSVIALRSTTGTLAWHFQFTPADDHDWDSNQTPILADLVIDGALRKVLLWANRNGFYYVLDRVSGQFIRGAPFVEQNWTKGLDARGRPIEISEGQVPSTGRLTKPGVAGGTNWQNAAFDAEQSLVFVPATEGASVFTKSPVPRRGDIGLYMASSGSMIGGVTTVVRALDAATGTRKWERYSPPTPSFPLTYSGLLATAGGLVFGEAGGELFALNSKTGEDAWRVMLGGETLAPPITFTVDGKQVIAASSGRALFLFGF